MRLSELMTAEVADLNRTALAIAAGSFVTLSGTKGNQGPDL